MPEELVPNAEELAAAAKAVYALDGDDFTRMVAWFVMFLRNSAMKSLAETPAAEWDYDEPRAGVECALTHLNVAVASVLAALDAMEIDPVYHQIEGLNAPPGPDPYGPP